MAEVIDVISQAWAQSPARVAAAIAFTPVVVVAGWFVLAVAILAGGR